MTTSARITRPMLLLDNGQRYYKCRNEGCLRARQWLHESQFYRLTNPASRCHRASECRQCSHARRMRQKVVDRLRRAVGVEVAA